ncbi:FliH/SctL family protein [Roseovarius salinarum]|uniref:FliH/SctL family protein n=1 Tax=Roseovarius salinarum TaxID=1981892 RepID=UPI000C3387F6|nr:flagellar biosynthesis protein [Roseovarius salinarum]
MTLARLLEDFGAVPASTAASGNETDLEEYRLEAFEEGYRAGWDDSAAAQAQREDHVAADLAANLQRLSFTYHEAHAHILESIGPLMTEMAETVLPRLAHETLGARIVEIAQSAIRETPGAPVVIVISDTDRAALEKALPDDPGFPVSIREDPDLPSGQVGLNLGNSELEIDLDAVLAGIQHAVSDFFSEQQEQTA